MYLIRLAIRPWRWAPLSQISGVLTVAFLLFLFGFLYWIQDSMAPVVNLLRTGEVLTAYLQPGLSEAEADQVADSISLSFAAPGRPSQADVDVVDAENFISEIQKVYPTLAGELLSLGSEMKDVVPRYITVSGILPVGTLEKIREVPGIDAVESSRHRFSQTLGAFRALQWVCRLLAAGVLLAMISSLIHLTRMNTWLHSETLSLFRLWGADSFHLLLPGALSGATSGLAGGAIAGLIWIVSHQWLAHQIQILSPVFNEMPMPTTLWGGILVMAGLLAGWIGGFLGALAAGSVREKA